MTDREDALYNAIIDLKDDSVNEETLSLITNLWGYNEDTLESVYRELTGGERFDDDEEE